MAGGFGIGAVEGRPYLSFILHFEVATAPGQLGTGMIPGDLRGWPIGPQLGGGNGGR